MRTRTSTTTLHGSQHVINNSSDTTGARSIFATYAARKKRSFHRYIYRFACAVTNFTLKAKQQHVIPQNHLCSASAAWSGGATRWASPASATEIAISAGGDQQGGEAQGRKERRKERRKEENSEAEQEADSSSQVMINRAWVHTFIRFEGSVNALER